MKSNQGKRAAGERPQKVLILGSGALQIGQAGEFDYSGSQAIKALREEGIATVLINPNIATVQTDEGMADATYFLPIEAPLVAQVIERERCDAILLGFGGQTALNCGLALEEQGILLRAGVRVLGTPVSAIRDTEDRALFVRRLSEIGVETARSRAVRSPEEAVRAASEIGYPVMLRSGFALGGKGSSIVATPEACRAQAELALASAPQILVEECLAGWKEIEYEVMRDAADNCVTVCNMENVDPMGIHTGESIVVAPSQTLDDVEYQLLRDIALRTIRHLGIVGECNIQYALDPASRSYRVIEVNARLSRSSALASKATGYPLAYVAAKVALGYTLPEIQNSITRVTTAFFEPALDYVVCKVPRWDLDKFEGAERRIGSEMKSVGEVMAIGRSFPEALQKAVRMLEIGADGLFDPARRTDDVEAELRRPTPRRIFAVAQALEEGVTVDQIHEWTRIDRFFLHEIQRVAELEARAAQGHAARGLAALDAAALRALKREGFSDRQIARIHEVEEAEVRALRNELGVRPKLSQIDTLAAEYPASTNFLYMSYAAVESDVTPTALRKVLVLGSGCYRIGSSVEFDWCAVNAARQARALGFEVIMLNNNPETVSTDYDICERLVFDEISVETVLELCEAERPCGVFVSMGGQTPNTLALELARLGVPILGTPAASIDRAEDRSKFSALLDELGVEQPRWAAVTDVAELDAAVRSVGGYPVLVRPSYVLSGAAMRVARSGAELTAFLERATSVNPRHPVVLSEYIEGAREVELDAVAARGRVVASAVCEHVEDAGTHSGDATLLLPPERLDRAVVRQVQRIGQALAEALEITGPFNLQALVAGSRVKVIECNLRASRSFPFVSKALGHNFAMEAARVMLGHEPSREQSPDCLALPYSVAKSPQFSFSRIKGSDPRSGVEMASTGEVACFGDTADEALLLAARASGLKIPRRAALVWHYPSSNGGDLADVLRGLRGLGLKVFGNGAAKAAAGRAGVPVTLVSDSAALVIELLKGGVVDLVICAPPANSGARDEIGLALRRAAVDLGITLLTEPRLAARLVEALGRHDPARVEPRSGREYVERARRPIEPLHLFVRQSFTEASAREQATVQAFLNMLCDMSLPDRPLVVLTGTVAQSEATFRRSFEELTGMPFTPQSFRAYRLGLLERAEGMIVLRTGLSESTAFELAYNIYNRPQVPVWMAVSSRAPIKTTLLQDLENAIPIHYNTFDGDVLSLRPSLSSFLDGLWARKAARAPAGAEHLRSRPPARGGAGEAAVEALGDQSL